MKVVILAGGLGTRLSEYTKYIPKPMIDVNGKPLIYHVMKTYAKSGFKEFIIASGYKGHIIKKYFQKKIHNWNISVIDTGKNTMTGGRVKRLKKYIGNETFFLTYGDGVSNISIKKLLIFHKKNKKMATLTAVRPPARFGFVKIKGNNVYYFKEKSKTEEGWINGGFFVIEPQFLNLIDRDSTFLEREPLEKATKLKQLSAFKHEGYWQCVDTKRDLEKLKKKLKINEK
jgi:glucose-1-phosphate cytidylyltransferase